jgi:hypothetical protein
MLICIEDILGDSPYFTSRFIDLSEVFHFKVDRGGVLAIQPTTALPYNVDVGVERWHTSKNVRAGSNDKGEHTMKPCTENGRVSTRWEGKENDCVLNEKLRGGHLKRGRRLWQFWVQNP